MIDSLTPERPLGVEFYPRTEDNKPCVGLKIWSHRRAIPLSERVPVLENMGFKVVDERTYEAAGGVVMRDLFEHDDGGWLQDPALLDRLVIEKLQAELAGLVGGSSSVASTPTAPRPARRPACPRCPWPAR